jgi:hypothetical protein
MKRTLPSKHKLIAAGLSATTLATTLLLTACSGDDKQVVDDTPAQHADIKFLYPIKDQQDVPTAAAIKLKTTSPISDTAIDQHFRVTDSNGNAVAGSIRRSDTDPTIASFEPTQALVDGASYQVHYDGLTTELGAINASTPSPFTTRIRHQPDFVVAQAFPRDDFPFMDFGSIYLWLSQDIDTRCVIAGDTVSLLDASGNDVDIRIVNQSRYMTIDPVEDLTPGATYRLVLADVCSQSGAILDNYELAFTAEASRPRAITPLNLTPSVAPGGTATLPTSPLTIDQPLNSGALNSVFLGPGSAINLSGQLQAELAYLPDHPDYSPFVIRAGNVLTTTSLDVNLAGVVPSLLSSGPGKLTLLSDAVGYMYRNPLAQSDKTTKAIIMTMDAALTVDNPTVNANISQNTMHVTVSGNAVIENGMMKIDASGICELRLLNVAWATTNLALHFETPEHRTPADDVLYTPPATTITLKTSYPTSGFDGFFPDDDPLLSFSDPIDLNTAIAGESVQLVSIDAGTQAQTPIDFSLSAIGGNLYLHPTQPLAFGTQFRITARDTLGDRFGNTLGADTSIDFSTPAYSTAAPLAPLVQGIFPGYACVLTDGNLAANDAGYCLGGQSDDVHFNVFPIPADVDVRVFFTQPMLASSIVLGESCGNGSFRVETIDVSGNCTGTVPGRLIVKQQQLAFKPDHAWQVDGLYRLTLNSSSNNAVCDPGEICGAAAGHLPLNTDPMSFTHTQTNTAAATDIGGAPLVIPFRGIAAKNSVFVPLLARPTSDINGNGKLDAEETMHFESYLTDVEAGATGIVSNFRIDCEFPPNCQPDDKLNFVNNTLFVDVGEYVAGVPGFEDGVNVDVHPTVLNLTSNMLYTTAAGILPLAIDTGPQQLRVLPKQGGSIASRIVDGGIDETTGEQKPPIFDVVVDAYYDAPYIQLLGGIADTSLKSLVVPMHLRGPVTFTADGRMIIDMALQNEVAVDVDIYILTRESLEEVFGTGPITQALNAWLDTNLGSDHKAGSIAFKIPAGTAGLYLVSEPLQ